MKVFISLIYFTVLLCASCSQSTSPSTSQILLDSTVDGKNLNYVLSQTFILELDAHGSAGYNWDCSIGDSNIVAIESIIIRPKSEPSVPGGLSVASFHFRTMSTGSTQIKLIEHQRWLEDAPINTIKFNVTVF